MCPAPDLRESRPPATPANQRALLGRFVSPTEVVRLVIGQRAAAGGAARHRREFGFSNPTGRRAGGKERESLTDPGREVGDWLARADPGSLAPPRGMEAGLEAPRTGTFWSFVCSGSPKERLLRDRGT